MYKVEVKLSETNWKEGAVGLLLPKPCSTHSQGFVGATLPKEWSVQLLQSENTFQEAFFVDNLSKDVISRPFTYEFSPRKVAYATEASEKLSAIVAHVYSRFTYDSQERNPCAEELCSLTSGNCIDINRYFLRELDRNGISARYNMGYYFKDGESLSDGQHCWVSTFENNFVLDWDIPHYLKFKLGQAQAGLNPFGGIRFAMSLGNNLKFIINGLDVVVHHLSFPRWVLSSGDTQPLRLNAKLTKTKSKNVLMEEKNLCSPY